MAETPPDFFQGLILCTFDHDIGATVSACCPSDLVSVLASSPEVVACCAPGASPDEAVAEISAWIADHALPDGAHNVEGEDFALFSVQAHSGGAGGATLWAPTVFQSRRNALFNRQTLQKSLTLLTTHRGFEVYRPLLSATLSHILDLELAHAQRRAADGTVESLYVGNDPEVVEQSLASLRESLALLRSLSCSGGPTTSRWSRARTRVVAASVGEARCQVQGRQMSLPLLAPATAETGPVGRPSLTQLVKQLGANTMLVWECMITGRSLLVYASTSGALVPLITSVLELVPDFRDPSTSSLYPYITIGDLSAITSLPPSAQRICGTTHPLLRDMPAGLFDLYIDANASTATPAEHVLAASGDALGGGDIRTLSVGNEGLGTCLVGSLPARVFHVTKHGHAFIAAVLDGIEYGRDETWVRSQFAAYSTDYLRAIQSRTVPLDKSTSNSGSIGRHYSNVLAPLTRACRAYQTTCTDCLAAPAPRHRRNVSVDLARSLSRAETSPPEPSEQESETIPELLAFLMQFTTADWGADKVIGSAAPRPSPPPPRLPIDRPLELDDLLMHSESLVCCSYDGSGGAGGASSLHQRSGSGGDSSEPDSTRLLSMRRSHAVYTLLRHIRESVTSAQLAASMGAVRVASMAALTSGSSQTRKYAFLILTELLVASPASLFGELGDRLPGLVVAGLSDPAPPVVNAATGFVAGLMKRPEGVAIACNRPEIVKLLHQIMLGPDLRAARAATIALAAAATAPAATRPPPPSEKTLIKLAHGVLGTPDAVLFSCAALYLDQMGMDIPSTVSRALALWAASTPAPATEDVPNVHRMMRELHSGAAAEATGRILDREARHGQRRAETLGRRSARVAAPPTPTPAPAQVPSSLDDSFDAGDGADDDFAPAPAPATSSWKQESPWDRRLLKGRGLRSRRTPSTDSGYEAIDDSGRPSLDTLGTREATPPLPPTPTWDAGPVLPPLSPEGPPDLGGDGRVVGQGPVPDMDQSSAIVSTTLRGVFTLADTITRVGRLLPLDTTLGGSGSDSGDHKHTRRRSGGRRDDAGPVVLSEHALALTQPSQLLLANLGPAPAPTSAPAPAPGPGPALSVTPAIYHAVAGLRPDMCLSILQYLTHLLSNPPASLRPKDRARLVLATKSMTGIIIEMLNCGTTARSLGGRTLELVTVANHLLHIDETLASIALRVGAALAAWPAAQEHALGQLVPATLMFMTRIIALPYSREVVRSALSTLLLVTSRDCQKTLSAQHIKGCLAVCSELLANTDGGELRRRRLSVAVSSSDERSRVGTMMDSSLFAAKDDPDVRASLMKLREKLTASFISIPIPQ